MRRNALSRHGIAGLARGVLALGLLAFGGALHAVTARAEDAPAAAAVAYADVGARLAAADAPLWLQLRLEADGRLGLRSRPAAADAAWTERGAWRLTGTGAEAAQALGLLGIAVTASHGAGDAAAALREPAGTSKARLIVDCAPGAPVEHVQWGVAAAAGKDGKVFRLTFLTGSTPAWVDMDLPQDRGVGNQGQPESATWFIASLVRNPKEGDAAAERTRIGISHAERPAPAGPDERPRHEGAVEAFFLPGDESAKEERAAVWAQVTEHLKAVAASGEGRLGATLRTPPPHGGRVHALDVVQLLARLQDAGCTSVEFEAAPAPR